MTTYEELLEKCKKHAKEKGIKLNPNPKIVEAILKGLLRNEQNKGAIYCPCRPVTGDKEEDKKKICPCFWHLDEIKKQGHCLCNLFVKSA
jgi:ferredoxin-thioredoxin reductase catalytic subunit